MAGWVLNSDGSVAVTVKVTAWGSSAGPPEICVAQFGVDCGPASSSTVRSRPARKEGASLTAVMVMRKSWVAVVAPAVSVAVTVRRVEPLASGAGV